MTVATWTRSATSQRICRLPTRVSTLSFSQMCSSIKGEASPDRTVRGPTVNGGCGVRRCRLSSVACAVRTTSTSLFRQRTSRLTPISRISGSNFLPATAIRKKRQALKPMNCIDRRRLLLSFAGLFGAGFLSPELREAGGDETNFRLTSVHQGTSSQRISLDLVSRRPDFCQMGYSFPRTAPLFHSFSVLAQRA
jgi:hypothetical protein